jgi:AcrR family transcriptional regulator
MPPDSTDTKRRLLLAACDEFARYGLAGARVDRIAEKARANKRLIYAYFGNKEQLFDTVMVDALGVLADAVPFSPDDLPGYSGALFDYMVAHPEMVRLSMWKQLERPAAAEAEKAAYRPKIAAMQQAQSAHSMNPAVDPVDLLMLVIGLVASWFTNSPSLHALAAEQTPGNRLATHRAAVVGAVTRISSPATLVGRG